ncbi:MAG: helix-turn-helix domain-containing protein [Patescibacteria group bacterium]|nr:helix-turn-helix domain-containing protein [Patescibacteria group bacterium]
MVSKLVEKQEAIELRKQGLTYSEILEKISVSKSTLSLWLRDAGLSKSQKQRLTDRKKEAQMKGGQARRDQRIRLTDEIHKMSEKEVGKISKRDLWLIGVALYWAEGDKEKEWNTGVGLSFANSDPSMIKLYLKWLSEILCVSGDEICCRVCIHENNRVKIGEVTKYWLDVTGLPVQNFQKVYFKKHKSSNRKNIGRSYHGLLVVRVKSSSHLNRKVAGWTKGMINNIV